MSWRKSLKALKKRVTEFSQTFVGKCSVVLMVLEGNSVHTCGTQFLCGNANFTNGVREACKSAVLQQNLQFGGLTSTSTEEIGFGDILKTHVFDMNVKIMRSIVASASSPPTSVSGNRFHIDDLWTLVDSLQQHLGIAPEPPSKKPNNAHKFVQFEGERRELDEGNEQIAVEGNRAEGRREANEEREEIRGEKNRVEERREAYEEREEIRGDENIIEERREGNEEREEIRGEENRVEERSAGNEEREEIRGEENRMEERRQSDVGLEESVVEEYEVEERGMVSILERFKNDPINATHSDCYDLLKLLAKTDWDALIGVCSGLSPSFSALPSAGEYSWTHEPLQKRFNKYIPQNMLSRDVPHDGNCFFSAVAVHLFNDCGMGMLAKLIFCVEAVLALDTLIDKVIGSYGADTHEWVVQSLSEPNEFFDDISTLDNLKRACQTELYGTLAEPYRDAGLFHIEMAPFVWKRNIRLHCLSLSGKDLQAYNRPLFCLPKDFGRYSPMHFAWIPSRVSGPMSHLIPVRPSDYVAFSLDECGASMIGRCLSNDNVDMSETEWIKCDGCGQWHHCACVGVIYSAVADNGVKWLCGCSTNQSTFVDIIWCSDESIVMSVVGTIDVKAICGAQLPWFRTPEMKKLAMCGPRDSYGPFSEKAVLAVERHVKHYVEQRQQCHHIGILMEVVAVERHIQHYVEQRQQCHHIGILMEVLIHAVMQRNGVNRLSAEEILLGLPAPGGAIKVHQTSA